MGTFFKRFFRSDAALCALIVLLCIVLHAVSLPMLYMKENAREEYRTESGLPYLSEYDSYLYCRLTEDLARDGLSSYSLRHSRGDDPLIAANATGEEGDVVMGLPLLGATVYKLLSWVPGVTPYSVIYWMAPFFASFTAIPVFLFIRRRCRRTNKRSTSVDYCDTRSGRIGGLVGAILVATASPFAWHTYAGFYDTDLGLALLPCVFLLCLAEALLAKDLRRQILWAAGSGFSLCVLSTFWRAYYAYFCIGAAAACCVVIALALCRLIRGRWLRLSALRGAGFGLAASVLFCLLTRGLDFFRDVAGILGNVGGSLANGDPAFPDASQFVSELNTVPLLADNYGSSRLDKLLNGFAAYADGKLNALGAWPVIIVTAATAVFLAVKGCRIVFSRKMKVAADNTNLIEDRNTDLLITAVFLGVWLVAGLVIMMKGSRFLTIPVLPVGIVCGLGVGLLHGKFFAGDGEESKESTEIESADAVESGSDTEDKKTDAEEPSSQEDTPSDDTTSRSFLRRHGLTLLHAGILLLAVTGWAFGFRAQFGWVACAIAGAVAAAFGAVLFIFRRDAIINLLAFTLMLTPCMSCFGAAYGAVPDGSDTLKAMCDTIREGTEPDATILSWWDIGYYYEYAAQRLTLGDGGNFNSEWNYWLGQALMTDNIDLTRAIGQMLAESGLDATHLLMERYRSEGEDYAARATRVLKTILPLPREEAYEALTGEGTDLLVSIPAADRLDAVTALTLLALTHPTNARPIYLVLSEDMLYKLGAISCYGKWEFGERPYTPYVRRTRRAVEIALGQTTEIMFDDCDFTLTVTRDAEGNITSHRLTDGNGKALSHCVRVSTEPLEQATGAYTIYLREEGANSYRCLLCSSDAADAVIICGFMMQGENLFYRSVVDLPPSDGVRAFHEVAVWYLGR